MGTKEVRTREEINALEKEIWNERTLDRTKIRKLRRHAFHFSYKKQKRILDSLVKDFSDKDVLELGSYTWNVWFKGNEVRPKSLTCINISDNDLETGKKLAANVDFKTDFRLMDANSLEFEDESFDVVFGGAILHHLDIEKTINHVHRVLRPNGKIVFLEPLNMNPLYKIYRKLNPKERTPDEHALISKDIAILKSSFTFDHYFFDFFSVATGFIALKVFGDKNYGNWLNRLGYGLDSFFSKIPVCHPLFARVIIYGEKK
ncbi:MAG: class I SAM-dependent methyltransferase [Bacteroidia bacterium]|nr:class I SAM-dependent methyltransferase [Bacteroidia bacterium]NND09600.1 class I SAM-dependent methyltransferase [Flavobacteriaceae bacterium]MBT8309761.1 class I SAM-dependent methyltransferase [Bacteroidia bacterium]NNK27342.1 class I SAM-dependent methyltransferase [Flavobacteriaceae bacterium]NNL59836.1 class I SAM-dependent methyltransferase [Flavobacteriaceae bacterium]